MESVLRIINGVLPYILLIILAFFTLVIISYVYGLRNAKKTDDTLQLALNTKGKIVMGILYAVYLLALLGTIVFEVQLFADKTISWADKIYNALNAPNFLTIMTFIAAIELQDIFFIGKKNILIGNRMFEIRRMRKMGFPKKYQMTFIYGQKEYSYSTRFVEISMLKSKFTKLK